MFNRLVFISMTISINVWKVVLNCQHITPLSLLLESPIEIMTGIQK